MRPELEEEWLAAVTDSGLALGELRVHSARGQGAPDGRGALYWSPDSVDWSNASTPLEMRELVDELGGQHGSHRFGLWEDHPKPVFAALLRHELEHARPWRMHGMGLFHLHEVMKPALYAKTDGLNHWGVIVNVAPIEIDANAAAARYVWSRHREAVESLLEARAGAHEPLFRYRGGPEPLETLPERTLQFMNGFRDRCEEAAATQDTTFDAVLDARWPGAADLWRQLGQMRLQRSST